MLIRQFRKYSPANILYAILIGLLISVGVFFNSSGLLPKATFSLDEHKVFPVAMQNFISPFKGVFISLILVFIQGFALNRLVVNFNLLKAPNYLTVLLFVSLACALPDFLMLSPILLCNFIIIWMLSKLFKIGTINEVRGLLFDLGLMVAAGTLLYYPFIIMMPLLWISLNIFRGFSWKEWASPLFGFGVVYFLLGLVYFWLDKLPEFYSLLTPEIKKLSIPNNWKIKEFLILIPILPTLILFFSALHKYFFKSVVQLRKSFQLVVYMFSLLVIAFFIFEAAELHHFLLMAPGLAISFAYYYTSAQNKWVYEPLFLSLVACILYLQYS